MPQQHAATLRRRARCHAASDYRSKDPKDISVVVFGATGYIGKKVTKEMINMGFNVVAVARERSGISGGQTAEQVQDSFKGATCKFADVMSVDSLQRNVFEGQPVDVVISCLASRTGGIQDSWDVDYQVRCQPLSSLPYTVNH